MTDDGSPWKNVLERYFPDFLVFFSPVVHAATAWAQGHVFWTSNNKISVFNHPAATCHPSVSKEGNLHNCLVFIGRHGDLVPRPIRIERSRASCCGIPISKDCWSRYELTRYSLKGSRNPRPSGQGRCQ